jgi:hypothetical protein
MYLRFSKVIAALEERVGFFDRCGGRCRENPNKTIRGYFGTADGKPGVLKDPNGYLKCRLSENTRLVTHRISLLKGCKSGAAAPHNANRCGLASK